MRRTSARGCKRERLNGNICRDRISETGDWLWKQEGEGDSHDDLSTWVDVSQFPGGILEDNSIYWWGAKDTEIVSWSLNILSTSILPKKKRMPLGVKGWIETTPEEGWTVSVLSHLLSRRGCLCICVCACLWCRRRPDNQHTELSCRLYMEVNCKIIYIYIVLEVPKVPK